MLRSAFVESHSSFAVLQYSRQQTFTPSFAWLPLQAGGECRSDSTCHIASSKNKRPGCSLPVTYLPWLDSFHLPIFLIFVMAEKLLTERGNSLEENLSLHPVSAGSNTNFILFRILRTLHPLESPSSACGRRVESLGLFRFWRGVMLEEKFPSNKLLKEQGMEEHATPPAPPYLPALQQKMRKIKALKNSWEIS